MQILNVRHPPQPLPHALDYNVKRAIVEREGERDDGEASCGQQFECFGLLSQQDVVQLEHLQVRR